MTAASVAFAAPASAATVYEIDGRWAEGTPAQVGKGDVVNAEWRVNVNDDASAPANEPIDNVTFAITLDKGLFKDIPDVCATADVDPVSAISEDGRTLTCNLGTVAQGTAVAVQTPVVADGLTGDQITATGDINGQTKALDPIDIVNTFGMDMLWGTPTSYAGQHTGPGNFDFDFEWTLFQDRGSDAGPDSVSYDITVNMGTGQPVELGVQANYSPYDASCLPFRSSAIADGHPYSEWTQPEKNAPFVDDCQLVQTGPNTFRMTLTGIDYSQTIVPTLDSAGNPMPTDKTAVASGSVWFRVLGLTQGTSANLSVSAPTYRSTTGIDDLDDASNNTSSKTITFPGGWSHAYPRPNGGNAWDNSLKHFPGAQTWSSSSNVDVTRPGLPSSTAVGECIVLDTQFVTYGGTRTDAYFVGDPQTPAPDGMGAYAWYVGTDPTVTPGNAAYDPGAFTGCGTSAGWVTTEPSDPNTVRAVRWTSTVGQTGGRFIYFHVYENVKESAPIGQDVWTHASTIDLNSGTWINPGRTAVPADQTLEDLTPVPGGRYPYTTYARDVMHIVFALPAITKAADRSVVQPGVPATFSLNYSANGSGTIPETVDDYTIVDTLPLGMTYVPGSANPEPAVVTDGQGRQVLTWELDGVPTNAPNVLTYQAVAADSVSPGQTLTNEVTSSLRGETSPVARAQVTTSTSGYTAIAKTTTQWFIANPDGDGSGEEGSWTVSLRSQDPLPQAFTDTIDILPYNGDGRGTSYAGTYELTSVNAPAGATVYYTDADPATLSDDPSASGNGTAGSPSAMWTTTKPANPTAIRVVGGELAPGATFAFTVNITPDGAEPGDVWVNRAQARAEHTELVMRTSEPLTMGTYYSASLKKYVQDVNGEWHDANDAADYPSFRIGDTIKYRIVVENTGQGTITNLTVSDDKQPELGAFVVEELAPGATESHEYEIVADESLGESSVNTACATADQPSDAEDPVQVNCDPAGVVLVGDPTHEKSLISAEPIGDGQWEVVFGIDVTNEDPFPTSYDLDDTLHFMEQANIDSAVVSVSPDGVTLADPAWNGQDNVRIASGVPMLAADAEGYEPHHYEVTVIADVPISLDGAGSGDDDPTRCGPDGDDTDRAFNNTSAMIDPSGTVEEDQACAMPPSITIDKTISSGPTSVGENRWSVVYDIVATNAGGAAGEYAVYDKLLFGGGIEIVSADVVTVPRGVTAESSWTGVGDDVTSEPNLIASGVVLDADSAHTYQVRVVVIADADELSPGAAECAPPGSGERGGLANAAVLEHNGNAVSDDVCPTVPGLGLAITGASLGGALGVGALLLLLGGMLVYRRRQQTA